MCIILIMIVSKNHIIFLINSSPSRCRLTVTNSIFFISYIRNVKTVNTHPISHINECVTHSQIGVR